MVFAVALHMFEVRVALGMSMRQLSLRMGAASPTSVAQIEAGEVSGGVTLRSLQAAADALECDLVYGLVPRSGSLAETLAGQARRVAGRAVAQTDRHMELEDQGVAAQRSAQLIDELADELLRGSTRKLWDEDVP